MSAMAPYTREIYSRVVNLRKAGKTCRETAEIVGCKEWQVYNVMRHAGLSGEIKARSAAPRRKREPRKPNKADLQIKELLSLDYSVLLEPGLNGGFICTIDDDYTGIECATIPAAIRSAMNELEG